MTKEIGTTEDIINLINNAKMLILYVNIRSLRQNFENLELLLAKLENKPKVIVCSEI